MNLLDDLAPANVLELDEEFMSAIFRTAFLCVDFAERKHEKLFNLTLKESCNTLLALVVFQYSARSKEESSSLRSENITRAFRSILEFKLATVRSPAFYA